MDERQTQLVAAAEATRKWIYAQRAIWAEGYPQSLLRPAQPQFAATSAFVTSPSAAITPFESSPVDIWADADRGTSFQDRVAERFGEYVDAVGDLEHCELRRRQLRTQDLEEDRQRDPPLELRALRLGL